MDIVAYRCAASSEDEEQSIAKFRVDDMMNQMLLNLQCEKYVGFLSGSGNFRYRLYEDYKANRKGKPRPKHLQFCRDVLKHDWNTFVTEGIEADDALGIAASHESGSIICSIDKDLMQIPGDHYNFVKDLYEYVGGRSADLNFWTQLLVGDTSDNIHGIRGIGPVKAKKILDPLKNNQEWFSSVRKIYADDKRFLTNLNLFWIQRNERKIWIHEHPDLTALFPCELVQEVEQKFSTPTVTISLPNGSTELDGTSVSTTLTEVTA